MSEAISEVVWIESTSAQTPDLDGSVLPGVGS